MNFDIASFVIGLLLVPVLFVLWVIYTSAIGRRGTIQTTAYYIEHPVGSGIHSHRYSSWLPQVLGRAHFKLFRVEKKCVYAKLDKTPPEVWDDEIKDIIDSYLMGDSDQYRDSEWLEAERILRAQYGDVESNYVGEKEMERIANNHYGKATLARLIAKETTSV